MDENEEFQKVDRRGMSSLVPISLAVICGILVALMLWPNRDEPPRQGPSESGMARPGAVKEAPR
jgi:hypothetical protein